MGKPPPRSRAAWGGYPHLPAGPAQCSRSPAKLDIFIFLGIYPPHCSSSSSRGAVLAGGPVGRADRCRRAPRARRPPASPQRLLLCPLQDSLPPLHTCPRVPVTSTARRPTEAGSVDPSLIGTCPPAAPDLLCSLCLHPALWTHSQCRPQAISGLSGPGATHPCRGRSSMSGATPTTQGPPLLQYH